MFRNFSGVMRRLQCRRYLRRSWSVAWPFRRSSRGTRGCRTRGRSPRARTGRAWPLEARPGQKSASAPRTRCSCTSFLSLSHSKCDWLSQKNVCFGPVSCVTLGLNTLATTQVNQPLKFRASLTFHWPRIRSQTKQPSCITMAINRVRHRDLVHFLLVPKYVFEES